MKPPTGTACATARRPARPRAAVPRRAAPPTPASPCSRPAARRAQRLPACLEQSGAAARRRRTPRRGPAVRRAPRARAPVTTHSPGTPSVALRRCARPHRVPLDGDRRGRGVRAHPLDAMMPDPPPTSHSSSPGAGASAPSVAARTWRLVSWPSCSYAASGSPGTRRTAGCRGRAALDGDDVQRVAELVRGGPACRNSENMGAIPPTYRARNGGGQS